MTAAHIAQKTPIPVEVEAGKDYWWCACGQSKRQPFCDGSHKGTAFAPVKWTAEARAASSSAPASRPRPDLSATAATRRCIALTRGGHG